MIINKIWFICLFLCCVWFGYLSYFSYILLRIFPSFFFNFFNVYLLLRDRERQSMNKGGTVRGGDTESKAGPRLWAVSIEPGAGLEPTNREIMTWAEVRRPTDSTQVPLSLLFMCNVPIYLRFSKTHPVKLFGPGPFFPFQFLSPFVKNVTSFIILYLKSNSSVHCHYTKVKKYRTMVFFSNFWNFHPFPQS